MQPYAWELRYDEALAVALLLGGYLTAIRFFPASRPRKTAFAGSVLLLLVCFETPLERIGLDYLLSAHLLQNVILAEWAPALAVVAVPPALAAAIARPPAVRMLTHPLVALPLWLGVYYVWHLPPVYDYALGHPGSILHLEHASYFAAGSLMWWPVLQNTPRRLSSGVKAGYVFAAFLLASPIGLLLALIARPVYGFYATAPERLWGLSRLTDQQIAGLTMASEQAAVFFTVFAFYFFRFFDEEERRSVISGSR